MSQVSGKGNCRKGTEVMVNYQSFTKEFHRYACTGIYWMKNSAAFAVLGHSTSRICSPEGNTSAGKVSAFMVTGVD